MPDQRYYYKGTDPALPPDAIAMDMNNGNIGFALCAWMLLTTNYSWLQKLKNGQPIPSCAMSDIAKALKLTPGCLEFILSKAKDANLYSHMMEIATEFQSINKANPAGSGYPVPCPDIGGMMVFAQNAVASLPMAPPVVAAYAKLIPAKTVRNAPPKKKPAVKRAAQGKKK